MIWSFRYAVFARESIRVEHEIVVNCDSCLFLLSESQIPLITRISLILGLVRIVSLSFMNSVSSVILTDYCSLNQNITDFGIYMFLFPMQTTFVVNRLKLYLLVLPSYIQSRYLLQLTQPNCGEGIFRLRFSNQKTFKSEKSCGQRTTRSRSDIFIKIIRASS